MTRLLIALLLPVLPPVVAFFSNKMVKHLPSLASTSLNNAIVKDLKYQLLDIASRSGRGEHISQSLKEAALLTISELETMNPSFDTEFPLLGKWELVFTDSQLFLNSPFFLAVRELFGKNGSMAKRAFQLHRLATSTGQIGKVTQEITANELISEVRLKVGLLPGVPFALEGTVVSKATYSSPNKFTFNLRLKETYITDANIPYISRLLNNRSLPTGNILKRFNGDISETKLITYYLDDTLRISRNTDGDVFVYTKEG